MRELSNGYQRISADREDIQRSNVETAVMIDRPRDILSKLTFGRNIIPLRSRNKCYATEIIVNFCQHPFQKRMKGKHLR